MSHTVTVRTATVTTSTSAIIINTGFMKTYRGALKLLELILGIVCVVLVWMARGSSYYHSEHLFFLLMATTFAIATFAIVLSCLLSISTDSILSKTIFEPIYHAIAFALVFAASINLLVKTQNNNRDELLLIASILGTINGVLYLFSTILGSRSYRGL
ncbi:hypothetical protein HCN44_000228 [Aphidius gifuensis]|uniref:MARVEL domain-containing protein n=1 Tax=Aphidius gifuensis TaxID=684658 RepID=A0A835CQP7_APHGI|nr:uncharacterized protein LOC122855193 [Aphidius gifuensis]XP_044012315.1 uncharacterized protein LOC122855193 [Aphidius gifuensis]KAF7990423.1 hypothetical protein HCN44_000228 [Aphidius gifuensis]